MSEFSQSYMKSINIYESVSIILCEILASVSPNKIIAGNRNIFQHVAVSDEQRP